MDKKKILIADDEPNIVSLLEDLLTPQYDVVRAYDGTTALAEIRNTKPEIILMDMMMPGLSGYEVLRLLQADSETKGIPVILITARDFDSSTEELFRKESNVVGFANKPLKSSELVSLIEQTLKANP